MNDGLTYLFWLGVLMASVVAVCAIFAAIRWVFFALLGRYNDRHPTYIRPSRLEHQ